MLHLPETLSLSNLEQNMIYIKGGIFEMGGESILSNAKPIHKVQLDDYYLCRYPVSQKLWKEVMGENPEELEFQNPHRPLERVCWDDITGEFLTKLREKTGRTDYCLPTEAQWEYAARASGVNRNSPQSPNQSNFTYSGSHDLKEVGWYDDNSFRETHPLSLKRPNALGLYGMSGNVSEWCQDYYDGKYYQSLKNQYGDQPAPNPPGPDKDNWRVVRGGSWYNDYNDARVAYRNSDLPSNRSYDVGFRLCRYREA